MVASYSDKNVARLPIDYRDFTKIVIKLKIWISGGPQTGYHMGPEEFLITLRPETQVSSVDSEFDYHDYRGSGKFRTTAKITSINEQYLYINIHPETIGEASKLRYNCRLISVELNFK